MPRQKVLLVTRKYPPIQGGMEQYAADLYTYWSRLDDVTLLANPAGNRALPRFLARASFEIARSARRYDRVHLADALLAVLIPAIRSVSKARISVTVHGLDITYDRYGYQAVVPRLVARADRVICVSTYTRAECARRGVAADRLAVVPNAIDLGTLDAAQPQGGGDIRARRGIPLDKPVLFSINRLVKRKGNAWFVREFMPKLRDRYSYVIAGSGPERETIERAVAELGLEGSVFLLGRIDDDERLFWYRNADAYVMPNVTVPNDPEGYGIVCLEASVYGLPVYTTGIEGIADQMDYCHPLEELSAGLRPRLGGAELERHRERVSWERVIEAFRGKL
ncbi:MAG TPA: glycosyltransferase family 4 protein [Polyangiaceae bacterium]